MIPEIRGNISESTPEVTGNISESTLEVTGRVEGVRGPRGYSAYEVAVREGGYVGTEEEWLASLVGPRGEKGDNGYTPIKGVDYFDGEKGDPGYTPQKGIDYTDGAKGEDGFSPKASVTKSGNTATITITDKNGTTSASITDGSKGNPGNDGYSPSITINDITGGHQIIITDKTGNHSFNVLDGEDGTTPVITATKSGTVTTIYANGVAIGTINDGTDGTDGDPGYTPVKGTDYWTNADKDEIVDYVLESEEIEGKLDKPQTDGTAGQVLTADGSGGQTWEDPTGAVEDVQVNGTSVVSQGVANIPIAGTSEADTAGLIKFGAGFYTNPNTLKTDVAYAQDDVVKAGTSYGSAINPVRQHLATFYGLAKAAGDSTQSASSNSVGTYTEEAKIAIQKMLGIYEAPWELIREDTFTNAEEANYEITVDSNGESFELTDAIIFFETPTQSTDSAKGSYGQIQFLYNNSYPITVECGSWTQAANTTAHGCAAMIEQKKGNVLMLASALRSTTSSNGMSQQIRYGYGLKSGTNGIYPNPLYPNEYIVTKVNIIRVTGTGHYILYGKRKWN